MKTLCWVVLPECVHVVHSLHFWDSIYSLIFFKYFEVFIAELMYVFSTLMSHKSYKHNKYMNGYVYGPQPSYQQQAPYDTRLNQCTLSSSLTTGPRHLDKMVMDVWAVYWVCARVLPLGPSSTEDMYVYNKIMFLA